MSATFVGRSPPCRRGRGIWMGRFFLFWGPFSRGARAELGLRQELIGGGALLSVDARDHDRLFCRRSGAPFFPFLLSVERVRSFCRARTTSQKDDDDCCPSDRKPHLAQSSAGRVKSAAPSPTLAPAKATPPPPPPPHPPWRRRTTRSAGGFRMVSETPPPRRSSIHALLVDQSLQGRERGRRSTTGRSATRTACPRSGLHPLVLSAPDPRPGARIVEIFSNLSMSRPKRWRRRRAPRAPGCPDGQRGSVHLRELPAAAASAGLALDRFLWSGNDLSRGPSWVRRATFFERRLGGLAGRAGVAKKLD